MIVVVFGLPGSGKSYFAARVADMINASYINSDRLRMTMFDKRTYSEREKHAVYNEMFKYAAEAEKNKTNLVLDATFYKKSIRKMFLDGVINRDNVIFIEVSAEESLIRERLQKPREHSEADFEVYKKIKDGWEPLSDNHLVLKSTGDNINDMLEKTAAWLQQGNDQRRN